MKIFRYAWSFISYKPQASMTAYHKKERRLLFQALVSGSPCFLMMTFHHIIHFPLMELISGELCVGIDPIVYLLFNTDIRKDFTEIFGWEAWKTSLNRRRIDQLQPLSIIGSTTDRNTTARNPNRYAVR